MSATSNLETRRYIYYGVWVLVATALFAKPFSALIRLSLSNDNTSHIVLIPFISAWLLYFEHRRIFQQVSSDTLATAIFLVGGVAVTL